MTSLNLNNALAVDPGLKGVPILGYLCWYTVYNNWISRSDLETKFIKSGTSLAYMPNEIKPVDAFRRATAELEENRLPHGEVFFNFLVREVACNKQAVVRHLIRETVDSKNVRLDYKKVGEITYYRDTDHVFVTNIDAGIKLSKIPQLYREYRNLYDGQHLRRIVRTVLADMNPAIVRPSGSVYFVPEKYEIKLWALERLVRLVGGEFFTMPLIDQENSRDMLYQKFTEQVEQSIEKLNLLVSDDATPAQIKRAKADSEALKAQIEEYEAILGADLKTLKEGLSAMRQFITVASLTCHVDEPA